MLRTAAGLCLALALTAGIDGTRADIFPQTDYPNFAEEGDFDPAVPKPSDTLGFRVGARPARHEQILEYFRALAGASPRALLETYGRTYEGRDLPLLVISSEENMSRLDEIKDGIARLSDPRMTTAAERDRLVDELPAICWMAYSIHGDELSGAEASLALAYRLVAGEDADAEEIRSNVVTLIDPLQNPDGHERYLAQIYAFNGSVPNSDTQGLSHTGVWPWGRTNHYLFDLNRDWFALVHPESRGRATFLTTWNPQFITDGHEMGSSGTFLLSPPREPFNPYMTPELMKWWELYAREQADAFDEFGWSYYTGEWNEEWFPGYGSSWAVYRGAVGILYEQSRTTGTQAKKPDGTVQTFGEAVHRQHVSSVANLLTSARNRKELLSDYSARRESALRLGREGRVKAFYFPPGDDPGRTRRLMETLVLQGMEVYEATAPISAGSLHDPWGNTWSSRRFPRGTYVVSLDQPDARLIRTIMDFHLQMPDSFLVTEREHLERQRNSRLYETTAWAVTLAYGVPVFWSGKTPGGSLERATSFPVREGGVKNPEAEYGFVIDGRTDASVRAAAHLLAEGFVVRAAREAFTVDGRSYPRGSFLLRRDANGEGFEDRLAEICRRQGVTAIGVTTALTSDGPDLGGDRFTALVEPKIAMLAGSGVSYTSQGSLWYLIDFEMGMRVSLLHTSGFSRADLGKYNVLVLPSSWGSYSQVLGERGVSKIKDWVQAGGTVIAVGSAASLLADESSEMSAVRRRRDVVAEYPPPVWGLDRDAAEAVGLFQATGVPLTDEEEETFAAGEGGLGIPGPGSPILGPGAAEFVDGADAWQPPPPIDPGFEEDEWKEVDARMRRFYPQGAYVRIDLDHEHWLTSGMPRKLPALISGSDAFIAKDPVRTVARFAAAESLHVGGLVWPEAAARLARTACMTREAKGRGQIILLAVEPYFRAYHHGTKRLFMNAAVLGPGMGTTHTTPW